MMLARRWILSLLTFLVAASLGVAGVVERIESVDGKTESVILGIGDFERMEVYGNPAGPFDHELHMVHIGEGRLFDIATNKGEVVMIQEVGDYAMRCGFTLRATRLYLYESEEDTYGGPLALAMENVVRLRFGEIRIRFIGDYEDSIRQTGAFEERSGQKK